ncbi:F0F1 ATP synthase subunit B [Aeromicrobium sp.]|nr:F0F1 ATP synthase subunit B [Candidatus Saccharibacteria bacterium]
MITLLTQFGAEESSGIGALGLDGKALLVQLATFILAFFVLRKFAFKPILSVLTERRELIESGVNLGEQMKKEKAELEANVDKTLAKARTEADAIIGAAQETSRDTIREAEDKARDKAAGILTDAEERIKTDTARARKKLEGELVGLISDATEAIIGEKVDAKKDAQLIDRALQGQKA